MEIKRYNIPAHIDIEDEIAEKEGLLTIVIRLRAGNIVDLTRIEYVDTRSILNSEQNPTEKFEVPPFVRKGSSKTGVWNNDNNGKR